MMMLLLLMMMIMMMIMMLFAGAMLLSDIKFINIRNFVTQSKFLLLIKNPYPVLSSLVQQKKMFLSYSSSS